MKRLFLMKDCANKPACGVWFTEFLISIYTVDMKFYKTTYIKADA
jgi:hypothetical protein